MDEAFGVAGVSVAEGVVTAGGELVDVAVVDGGRGEEGDAAGAPRADRVWTWDITLLRGPHRGTYYRLYVILDLFSRFVVGWMLAHTESGELAARVLRDACHKQGVGTVMTAEPGELELVVGRVLVRVRGPIAPVSWQQTLQHEDAQQRLAANVFRGVTLVEHVPRSVDVAHAGVAVTTRSPNASLNRGERLTTPPSYRSYR